MKAYWVANYTEIKDDERLKKYAIKAKEAVEKYFIHLKDKHDYVQ